MTARVHHIHRSSPAKGGYDGVLAFAVCRALAIEGTDGVLNSVCRSISGRQTRLSPSTPLIRSGQRQTVSICPEAGAGRPDIGLGASGGGGGGSGPATLAQGVRLAA